MILFNQFRVIVAMFELKFVIGENSFHIYIIPVKCWQAYICHVTTRRFKISGDITFLMSKGSAA